MPASRPLRHVFRLVATTTVISITLLSPHTSPVKLGEPGWRLSRMGGGGGDLEIGRGVVSVGREIGSGVRVEASTCSRKHARFRNMGRELNVEDLGGGGTFVNGQRITPRTPRQLVHGDTLKFGKSDKGAFIVVAPDSHPSRIDPMKYRKQSEHDYFEYLQSKEFEKKEEEKKAAEAVATSLKTLNSKRSTAQHIQPLQTSVPKWGSLNVLPRGGGLRVEGYDGRERVFSPVMIGRGVIVRVGRHPDCELSLIHTSCSRLHATLAVRRVDKSICIEDMGSSRGTYLNLQRIPPNSPVPLRSGDMVSFGKCPTKFFLSEAHVNASDKANLAEQMEQIRKQRLARTAAKLAQESAAEEMRGAVGILRFRNKTRMAQSDVGLADGLDPNLKDQKNAALEDVDWRILKYQGRLTEKQDELATKAMRLEVMLEDDRKEAQELVKTEAIQGGLIERHMSRLEFLQRRISENELEFDTLDERLDREIERSFKKEHSTKLFESSSSSEYDSNLSEESSSDSFFEKYDPQRKGSKSKNKKGPRRRRRKKKEVDSDSSMNRERNRRGTFVDWRAEIDNRMFEQEEMKRRLVEEHREEEKQRNPEFEDLMEQRETLVFLKKQLNETIADKLAEVAQVLPESREDLEESRGNLEGSLGNLEESRENLNNSRDDAIDGYIDTLGNKIYYDVSVDKQIQDLRSRYEDILKELNRTESLLKEADPLGTFREDRNLQKVYKKKALGDMIVRGGDEEKGDVDGGEKEGVPTLEDILKSGHSQKNKQEARRKELKFRQKIEEKTDYEFEHMVAQETQKNLMKLQSGSQHEVKGTIMTSNMSAAVSVPIADASKPAGELIREIPQKQLPGGLWIPKEPESKPDEEKEEAVAIFNGEVIMSGLPKPEPKKKEIDLMTSLGIKSLADLVGIKVQPSRPIPKSLHRELFDRTKVVPNPKHGLPDQDVYDRVFRRRLLSSAAEC
ncbi:hypothetical protein AAMO2058_000604900 [Amorphochlora amoebiformis]